MASSFSPSSSTSTAFPSTLSSSEGRHLHSHNHSSNHQYYHQNNSQLQHSTHHLQPIPYHYHQEQQQQKQQQQQQQQQGRRQSRSSSVTSSTSSLHSPETFDAASSLVSVARGFYYGHPTNNPYDHSHTSPSFSQQPLNMEPMEIPHATSVSIPSFSALFSHLPRHGRASLKVDTQRKMDSITLSTNNSENSVSAGGAQLRGGAFAAPPPSSSSSFSNAVHSVPPEASLVPTESSGRISPYSSGRYQLQQRLGHPSPPSPSPSSPQTLSHTGSYSSSTHNHHPSRTDSFNSYGHTPYIPQASLPIHSYPPPAAFTDITPPPPPSIYAPRTYPDHSCTPMLSHPRSASPIDVKPFPTAPPSTHASESSPKDTHIQSLDAPSTIRKIASKLSVPPSPPHQEGQVVKEKTTKRKARVEVEVEGEHDDDKNVDLKRMRNTEAARRSRAKKMAKMDMLEIAVEKLEVDNSRLVVKLAILESDKATWRTKQEEYIARIAQLEMQLSESHQAIIGKNE